MNKENLQVVGESRAVRNSKVLVRREHERYFFERWVFDVTLGDWERQHYFFANRDQVEDLIATLAQSLMGGENDGIQIQR